ncbi:MAG: peptidyl-prolyl cis-trans isomerase [Phycisphaerales bacterium]|nr:peptidyl-prolyl cis-trans isomerase [Phycisphaerales bacterium]
MAEKAEAERANKVAVRGASNVQATTQVSRTNGASALAAATAPSVQPISRAGAVSPDIVLVDAEPLCSAEVLYPLREQIAKSRTQTTRTGFIEDLYRAVRRQAQEEIGRILMFRGASAKFSDAQKTALDGFVKRELNQRVEREFDGSHARFELHLKEHGLTLDQYKAAQRRQIVVQQELYETIVPQLRLRRDELLAFYREHQDQYVQPESRELWMIEAPFERFLPEWLTWARADAAAQAQARLKTVRHIREAHTALSESTFAEVAMKYCRGVHASEGGAWGPIGKPLQAPYDLVSSPIFKFSEEQVSDPIETALGWCIVKCGKITPQRVVPFDEVQDEIRKAMMDERFATLAGEHVRRLAERASISSFEAFVSETVRLVATNSWPRSADGVE